jgi:hypothetical protein
MQAFSLFAKISRLSRDLTVLARAPLAHLHFNTAPDPAGILATYRNFTRPHPHYRIIRNKSMGVALIDLRRFSTFAEYLASVRGKGNAGPQSQKARSRGYFLRQLDQNHFVDEIYRINTSSETRQGRPMDPAYREKALRYEAKPYVMYFGIFNISGQLVAYCNVGIYGNFAATEKIMGYKNNDGVMYLLLTEIVGKLLTSSQLSYFMYDTVFGALDGLRDFKRRVGFQPYRVRYTIN